ncbi:MAG: helix-turn-helix transcriptional regulator [bacterium]|nr:helix-turn-helix transcriptional regulator [bacterium]
MHYREYTPPAELRSHVDCVWTCRPAASVGRHRVLPDGCIDLLIQDDGAARIVGTMTAAAIVAPDQPLVAVRFRPGGARAFFGATAQTWTDGDAALASRWEDWHAVVDQVLIATKDDARAHRLGELLAARAPGAVAVPAALRAACDALATPTPPAVASLAAQHGVSRQYFTRRFREYVGIDPQRFARIMRLQRLREIWQHRPELALVDSSLLAGFHDQAHMSHDVQELTGTTPRRLRRNGLTVID